MLARFWGTRGSLPTPLGSDAVRLKVREALLAARGRNLDTAAAIDGFIDKELPFSVRGTFGGNSSCVQIEGGDGHVICDMGSGLRELGVRMMTEFGPARPQTYNIFMSHVHWDHIMGLPFFTPAYIPGNVLRIHGCHSVLREALLRQQSDPCFPVHLDKLGATIEYVVLEPGQTYDIAGFKVQPILQYHHGDSYGYRFTRDGRSLVYSTDCEHKFELLDANYPFVEFFRNADLLIFDSMYSFAEAISVKADWGHSSNVVAVELAQLAHVKHLVLFHHEPVYDDRMLETILGETIRFEELSRDGGPALRISSAYDGLEIAF